MHTSPGTGGFLGNRLKVVAELGMCGANIVGHAMQRAALSIRASESAAAEF